MANIAPLPTFIYQPVLPAVFDDSLSYLEMIGKIYSTVQKLVEEVNSIDSVTQEYVDNAITQAIIQCNQYATGIGNSLDLRISNLVTDTTRELNNLRDYINNQDDVTLIKGKVYTDEKVQDAINQFSDMIENGFLVYNPCRGYKTSVGLAIYDLYNSMRIYGIGAQEYDSLLLTAEQYDNKMLTASEYDYYGVVRLSKTYGKIISPISGEFVTVTEAINQLANLHRKPVTATYYDGLNLTATAYDNKNLTAYRYDFEGQLYLAA